MYRARHAVMGLTVLLFAGILHAQDAGIRKVAPGDAKEVVATINGGFGTLFIKKGRDDELLTVRQKQRKQDGDIADIGIDYRIENGVGYLTVDMGTEGQNDMNGFAALLKGHKSRTWYMTISDRIPVRFNVTLGAGRASIDLTGIHVREFHLDAGAGSVRLKSDSPNREEIGRMSVSAGVGTVRAEDLGNLRFNELIFEGGLGEYMLDCRGELPDNTTISADVGVGSLTIVLPMDVGAKALPDNNWLSSRKMYGFVRNADESYVTTNYDRATRRVLLDLRSGLGSISVRRGK
jgi:hypothetical protein